ncbi:MAG: hypothetical protein R3E10_19395 [Gemmatimonadota bacterium]
MLHKSDGLVRAGQVVLLIQQSEIACSDLDSRPPRRAMPNHRLAAALPHRVGLLLLVGFAAIPSGTAAQDYHTDIRPIIEGRCLGCHAEDGVAFSMEDADRAYGRRGKIGEMLLERRMPPWLAEAGHQSYVGDPSLSGEELERVRRWVDAGYPRGTPQRSTARPAPLAPFRADLTLDVTGGRAYLPDQGGPDEYRCFVLDWPRQTPGFITGFKAVPGNLHVSHHVVVHAIEPPLAQRFHELEGEEEGAGYRCFGGALPDRFNSRTERDAYDARYTNGVRELSRGNFWLAHWAPGMDGYTFPEGTGIAMKPGAALVVQMHYYTRHAPGESDQGSLLEFQLADEVERPAVNYPLTQNRWLNGERNGSMVVGPGAQATYEVSESLGDLLGYLAFATQVPQDSIEALEIHSANLHMHSFGHSGVVTLTDGNGRRETLLSIPRWDLGWQRDFTFVHPKVFGRDGLEDVRLSVQCTFENSTDRPVYGGYGSDEEMCFNFSYIAVRAAGRRSADGSNRGAPRR